ELEQWAAQAGLVPVESQYLAQKNGFQIQIHGYASNAK
ncbi:MAG: ArsR family transcriptional regulator, partial [Pseudomonadales bacterium]|nr:ArsR family transcriptional regulator [Pseudomonadales bacterium]NIX07971.1 ArsR family transcriptional regulator [Pseudomonadales bacterium]